jgi:hypothetical protein
MEQQRGGNYDKMLWIDMKSKHDLQLMDQLISPLPKLRGKISVGMRHQAVNKRNKSRRHLRNKRDFWV